MTKERRNEFDLIRAVSTVAIVLFHYSYSFVQYAVGGEHVYFMMHANGTWGALFVSLFFMLSGSSLYYNWKDRLQRFKGKGGVIDFYIKRFLSIFPMFYIGWFFFYLMYVISFNWLWNWGGDPKKLLLTVFGLDGYFLYRGVNYYTIGEWFLGAIIMIYALYPLLQYLMKKVPVLSSLIVVLLFGLNIARHNIPAFAGYNARIIISDNINMITCIFSFWIGMLLIRAGRKIIRKLTVIPAVVVSLIFVIIPFPVSTLIISPLLAVCFYIILSAISLKMDSVEGSKFKWIYDKVIGFFSKYSYPIFLVHHVIVQKAMSFFTGKEFNYPASIGFFFVVLSVISVAAVLLSKTADAVVGLLRRKEKKGI